MNKIDYTKLQQALNNLKEQYENSLTMDEQDLSEATRKAIKNSVVMCFAICYDTLWKHMKKHLEEELPSVPGSPLKVFRIAKDASLINEEMQENLVKYNELRRQATHDYSMDKANDVLAEVGNFIEDASKIYRILIAEK